MDSGSSGNGALAKLDNAVRMLAEAQSLDEIKYVHDVALAAKLYAQEAGMGLEAQNSGAEIVLRAERKGGQLLDSLPREPGKRTDLTSCSAARGSEYAGLLDDIGIDRFAANRWQKIAALPDAVFEGHIAAAKEGQDELTRTGVLRVARELEREARREANAQQIETVIDPAAIPDRFSTIVIDPPWDWGDEGDVDQMGRARPTYNTMTADEVSALPIDELALPDSHLYLWITNRSLPKGFYLLAVWGFRYITCLTWVKPHYGMGNYFRGQTEHLLFGVRGSLPLLRRDAGTVIHAPRGSGGHSSKPAEVYALIETCSPGPYLDMFSRQNRRGWHTWGEGGYGTD